MSGEFAPEPEHPDYYEGVKDRRLIKKQQELENAEAEVDYPTDDVFDM